MNSEEFRHRGKEMIEYICGYLENIAARRVTPSVEPGYLRNLIPPAAPDAPETWDAIMADVERKIMPGVTHWQHPRFHAYFPSGNSFPSILGDMLADAIGCIGFSWAASPACTELETIVLDWLAKAIGLPAHFQALAAGGSTGGGVIQTSASECVLVCMLAARAQALKRLKQQHPFVEEGVLLSKLMAYCSKEAHSCVEKAAMICFVKLRILEPDEKSALRGRTLASAMDEDERNGLVPFFVSATLGTTSCCSFDNLVEIGGVVQARGPCVWLHVDGAYAGNAFICPELKPLLAGIEYADSFNTNPNKWLLVNFDCSTMWVRDRLLLTSALVVDPLYLQHGYSDTSIDYRHWGVPLSRRFRSLKLWFVMRTFGISGLQAYIRHHIALAKQFEALVLGDTRFEVCNEVKLGLVCFRLKGGDKINEKLLSAINGSGKLHMVPAQVNERYVIRFCAVAQNAVAEDIEYAWRVIVEFADELLAKEEEEEKDQEVQDEVFEILDRKRKETLAHKRSFFVRMVSDPKIYNPSIAKGTVSRRHTQTESVASPDVPVQPNLTSSWISWPIAFILQGMNEDRATSDVPIRFRHLDTKVRLSASNHRINGGGGSSPSPERAITAPDMLLPGNAAAAPTGSKSPKRSPIFPRKANSVGPAPNKENQDQNNC